MPTNDSNTNQDNTNNQSNIIRNLDYLADLTDGVRFTAIPDRVQRAFIDNEMPVSKYKLLCVMLTHSRNFQIWSTYLRNRFDARTLKKYIAELTDEGYIRVEKVTTENKRTANVYHVNSIYEWSIYKDAAPSPPRVVAHGVQEHGVQEHPLRISTEKENKRKIDKASSISQNPKNKFKLTDHEFVKELKAHRQTSKEKLQKIRDEVSILEKKIASQEAGKLPREVFIEYLPKKVSVDPALREKISTGLSGFGLAGDSTQWSKALLMAYKLQAGIGLEGYKRVILNLRRIEKGDITAQDFANLYSQGFEEKYGKPLYDFLILG